MRIRPSCWRPSLAFAVLALLSLVAAACGDDDDSEPAGSTVESEAPTTSADDGEAEAPADSDDGEAEAPADSDDGEAEAPAKRLLTAVTATQAPVHPPRWSS